MMLAVGKLNRIEFLADDALAGPIRFKTRPLHVHLIASLFFALNFGPIVVLVCAPFGVDRTFVVTRVAFVAVARTA